MLNNLRLYFLHLPDLVAAEFSALEEIGDDEAVSISVPSAMPPASTSLRDYVDQSETLSKLVQLGNKTAHLKKYCQERCKSQWLVVLKHIQIYYDIDNDLKQVT